MASRRIVLPSCLVLAAVLALVAWLGGRSDQSPPALAPVASTRPLDVWLDPSGRPYDAAYHAGARISRRPLAVLHAPSRRVLFAGGESVAWLRAQDVPSIELAERPGRRYPVVGIWLDRPGRGPELVGVVLLERAAQVVRWKLLDPVAYGTDGGTGGITTPEWAAQPKGEANEVSRLYMRALVDERRQWFRADVDGVAGDDTVVFSNGFGDGGFPSLAGYDASGRRDAVVLWSNAAPWRIAFEGAAPPREVTETEDELAACLAGRRTVNGLRCRVA